MPRNNQYLAHDWIYWEQCIKCLHSVNKDPVAITHYSNDIMTSAKQALKREGKTKYAWKYLALPLKHCENYQNIIHWIKIVLI